MAFTAVTSLDADTTIAIGGFNKKLKKDNPTEAEGYYLGTKVVDSAKSKSGKACLHILQTPDGNLGVWGKTDMDRKLSQVEPGTMTRISYRTMKKVPTGEMYIFNVEVDKGNTIEVNLSGGDDNGNDYGDADPEQDYGRDDDGDDSPHASLAAAESQSRVQELLSRSKAGSKVAKN